MAWASAWRSLRGPTVALLLLDALDEMAAGVPVVSAPAVRSSLGLDYEGASGLLLVLPVLAGLGLEAPLMGLAHRKPKLGLVLAMVAIAACLFGAAWSPSPIVTWIALALWAPAGGVAAGLARATLIDANPDARERMMARWTFYGWVGDALVPGLVAAVAWAGGSWELALCVLATAYLVHAGVVAAMPWPATVAEDDDEDDGLSWWQRLGAALRNPTLAAWLVAATLCNLLDEIFVAFGSMYLRDSFGLDENARGLVWTAYSIGGALGLVWAERRLRHADSHRLLLATCLVSALAYVTWMLVDDPIAITAAVFVLGLATASHYPITMAKAYASHRGPASVVDAIDQFLGPLNAAAPLLLGWLADRYGIAAAMWVLLLQPIGIAVVAVPLGMRKHPSNPADASA